MVSMTKIMASPRKQAAQGFAERLNNLLDQAGMPGAGFARHIEIAKIVGVNQQTAYNWLEGKAIPNRTYMPILVEKFKDYGICADWMITGNPSLAPDWYMVFQKGTSFSETGLELSKGSTRVNSIKLVVDDKEVSVSPSTIQKLFKLDDYNYLYAVYNLLTINLGEKNKRQVIKDAINLLNLSYLEEDETTGHEPKPRPASKTAKYPAK